jgi:hypothetical protein
VNSSVSRRLAEGIAASSQAELPESQFDQIDGEELARIDGITKIMGVVPALY